MKALAIILNVFFPGVGTIVAGKVGMGVGQLIMYVVGIVLIFTVIGVILGGPLMLAAWIWGLVSVINVEDRPQIVHVVHQNATGPAQSAPTDATTPEVR